MGKSNVILISLVLLCDVRDVHADSNLTAFTEQLNLFEGEMLAWRGTAVNIEAKMINKFNMLELSLRDELNNTFISASIMHLVKQAIADILREDDIGYIFRGHVRDVVTSLKANVHNTKSKLQAVTRHFEQVELERDTYKESVGKFHGVLTNYTHSLQLQLNETVAELRDAKMMNTAIKEVLMTLNSSYVRAAEQSVSAEQSYREGLREMQQKIQELEERDALHVKAIQALNRTKQNRTDARGKQPAYQIAFSTGLTHDVPLSRPQVLRNNNVFLNVGNAYNRDTGVFICPQNGIYSFQVHALSQQGKLAWLELTHNNHLVVSVWGRSGGSEYDAAGNSAILQLAKGDQVWVRSGRSAHLFGRPTEVYVTFSGYLIAPSFSDQQ